jgi:coproporphyrinogen III oxidase
MDIPSPLALQAEAYFRDLQRRIMDAFIALESNGNFIQKPWQKPSGEAMQGGGMMSLMHGEVFEKVGVNFSCVNGCFSEHFAKVIPGGAEAGGRFWASGVSVVAHMKNPRCPSVHFNVRRIETGKSWFGGGADLTPTFEFQEDTQHFHDSLKAACDGYRAGAYAEYKKWCDEYFFIPHRGEARGVGGVFFDYVDSGDAAKDFAFVQAVAQAFLDGFCPLVERRKGEAYSEADKDRQLTKRGRYAEFNLLYDRGTKFGLQTGGNAEAILMSLPPLAKWE